MSANKCILRDVPLQMELLTLHRDGANTGATSASSIASRNTSRSFTASLTGRTAPQGYDRGADHSRANGQPICSGCGQRARGNKTGQNYLSCDQSF